MEVPERDEQERTAFIINKIEDDLDVEAESKSKPKIVSQDSSQSYIAQCLARLVRYRRGTLHSDGLKLFNDMLEELAPEGPKIHTYMDRYFVIQNVRKISIYEWKSDELDSLDYSLLLHRDYDEIDCLDLIETHMGWACQDSQGRGLSLAVVTINRNQIYSLHYNQHKIDLNEKIYAITFLEGGTLLVHLEREVMLYTIDTNGQFVCQKQLTKPKQAIFHDQFLNSKDMFTKYHRGKVYVAYLVRKNQCSQGPCNLVLDIIEITPDYNIQFKTRILEFYQKVEDQRIQDFVMLENEQDPSFLLILHKQIILVKMKKEIEPKIECPHEWDDSENIFAIMPQQIGQAENSQQKQDLVMLVKYCKSFQQTKKETDKLKEADGKLILLDIQTYQNHIKKQQFQTSLRDIIIINKDDYPDLGERRLIKCCVVNGKMIFFFFYTLSDQTKHVIQIFFSRAINPFNKLKKLLPQKLNHKRFDNLTEASADGSNKPEQDKKPSQNFIPKEDLKLLLILNQTYKVSNTNRKNLYMCVWQKIKALMDCDGDNSNIETYTGYLYKTCDLKYVKNELTELREKRGVQKNSFFRKHYIAVKKMAKEKLQQCEGNRDQNFKTYLKSTFLLKKLSLNYGSNDVDIKPKDFNNWKKRDIRVTFYDDIKARMKPQIREFINLFKSYFIYYYEDIIQNVLSSEIGKSQSSLLDNKQILYVLLPHYISDKSQGDQPGSQRLAFEVSGLPEETCFEDLKFNTSRYTEADLMKCKNQMSHKYMRSNDFLFRSRKQLIEKEEDLVHNHQAIYTFLSIINKKQEQKGDPKDKQKDQNFIDFLAEGNFIDLKLRLRLSLYTKLYKLYKEHIDQKISMKEFLPISEAQIYCNVIFNSESREETQKRITFLLKQIVMVWSFINKSVDRHLEAEDSRPLYSIDADNTPTFQTFLPQSFELAAQKYTDKEVLERLRIFLSVLEKIQDKAIGDRQLTIQKILLIIFKFLRTDYITETIQLFELVDQLKITVEQPSILEKPHESEESINEQLKKTFEIIRNNIDLFKQFDIKETFERMENRDEFEIVRLNQYIINLFFENYLIVKPTDVVFQGQTYNVQRLSVLLDLMYNFTSTFYRTDQIQNESEERNEDWRMTVFGIFLDVMLKANLERTTERPLLDEATEVVDRQDPYISTAEKRGVFHHKLRVIIAKAKEIQNANKDKKGSNNQISEFISKCLETLKKGTEAISFVKQEELMQKLEQARYDIKDLEKIRTEKQRIIDEISVNIPRHLGKNKLQKQQNLDNAAKIRILFDQSVSKKCDDYIASKIKGKQTQEDAKRIINELENADDLFEPLFLILSAMDKSKIELVLKEGKEKQKQSKQKNQQKINRNIAKVRYEALYNYIRKVHRPIQLIEFVQDNWDKLLCQTALMDRVKLPSDNYACDVEMYYYVPEFLNEPKYYVFVQLLYADYQRAMRYYLRYRGTKEEPRLGLDLSKIIQLIKIFLKRNKSHQARNLELTLQMLVNRFNGNMYVIDWMPAKDIKKNFIDKTDKAAIKDNDNKIVFAELQSIYGLYQQYLKEQKEEISRAQQDQKNITQAELAEGIQVHSHAKTHNSMGERRKLQPQTESDFFDQINLAFDEGRTRDFIELVETYMEKKEQTNKKSGQFNMYYFRLFTRCVKFDQKLIRLFKFDIFYDEKMQFKENDEDGIKDTDLLSKFRLYLRPNIEKQINSDNYIQIAKAIRFGFNNCAELEFEIIMIYLAKLIEKHTKYVKQNQHKMEFNREQEEIDLERSIKLVLDNIDSSTLKQQKKRKMYLEAGMTPKQITKIIGSL